MPSAQPRPGGRAPYRRPRRADEAGSRGAPGPGRDDGPTRRIARSDDVEPGAGRYRRGDRRERPAPDVTDRVRLPWADRVLRGLAGLLAGGLVVLALGITVVWFGAESYGLPGPGADVVAGHWIGAVLAVVGQRVADRRPDRTGTLAALLVVLVTALVLGFAWFL